jgi:hypothetical protein
MALTVKIESGIGVLECWQMRKPEFQPELLFHYSIAPSLQDILESVKDRLWDSQSPLLGAEILYGSLE